MLSIQGYAIKASLGYNIFFWGLVICSDLLWSNVKKCGAPNGRYFTWYTDFTPFLLSQRVKVFQEQLFYLHRISPLLWMKYKRQAVLLLQTDTGSLYQNWSWNWELLGSSKTFYKVIFPPKRRCLFFKSKHYAQLRAHTLYPCLFIGR